MTKIITMSLRERKREKEKSPTFHKSEITEFLQMALCYGWMSCLSRWSLYSSVVLHTSGTKHVAIPTTCQKRENISEHFAVPKNMCVCAHVSPKLEWQCDQWEGKCPVSTFCLEGGWQWLSQVISLFDGHSSGEAAFAWASLVFLA